MRAEQSEPDADTPEGVAQSMENPSLDHTVSNQKTTPNCPIANHVPLVNALYQASQRQHAAFYAPGHKQGQGVPEIMRQLMGPNPFGADLPELPELDNLFAPEGVIQEAQELAAQTFGAGQTWFLANGSTCGIEAAILATCGPGDRIILPRNVHQSVISALILSGAVPIFVAPEYDPDWDMAHGITPEAIASALAAHPNAKAILLVSPTYYGTCSDVTAIAHLAHQHGIPLLVDEAHGPHFGFHPDLPSSALTAGADLVVQSTHKVLSAMSQASMLHLRRSDGRSGAQTVSHLSPQRISQVLQLVQSTSPNYLLLASLDAARYQMATQGHALMQRTLDLAHQARIRLKSISGLRVFEGRGRSPLPGVADHDPTRLTVDVTGLGLTGFEADGILHTQLGVTAELPTQRHLTFIISLGNTAADIDRLIQGFQHLSSSQKTNLQTVKENPPSSSPQLPFGCAHVEANSRSAALTSKPTSQLPYSSTPQPLNSLTLPLPPLSPRDAFFAPTTQVAIAHAPHHISAELICPYPPGIPLVMPGEEITPEMVRSLQATLDSGGFITGCTDPTLATVLVVDTAEWGAESSSVGTDSISGD